MVPSYSNAHIERSVQKSQKLLQSEVMNSRPYSGKTSKFAVYSLLVITLLGAFALSEIYLVDRFGITSFYRMHDYQTEDNFSDTLRQYLDKASRKQKILLRWHPEKDTSRAKDDTVLDWRCGSCLVTSNTGKLNDDNTAAVVILYYHVKPKFMPPSSSRKSHQLYVWLTQEAPGSVVRRTNLSYADSVGFNVTMSYRRDADIYFPYGGYSPDVPVKNISKIIETKKHLALAIVSNCDQTPGARFRRSYLNFLSKNMKLDTLGRCFKAFFPRTMGKAAFTDMISEYKFYFALENSYHCRDYITEKFHSNAIKANAVPVVWGPPRSDYEAVVHPKSFIHIDDFKKPEDLIRYLKYLDKNDTAYAEYFQNLRWMGPSRYGSLLEQRAIGECQLCRMVNGINVDDRFGSQYNGTDILPHFTETVSRRTVSVNKWIHKDRGECFQISYETLFALFSRVGIFLP